MMNFSNHHLPHWLHTLLTEKFFNACLIHEEHKKNEKNIFCLNCSEGICPHCISLHHSHNLLQVRRYVYHDVLRLGDAEKLMNCGYVQSYTTNSAKVVFLNERPQTRPCRGSGNICITCDRALQDPYYFCSLSCKLNHIVRTNGNLSECIVESNCINLPDSGIDEGQLSTETTVIDVRSSSGSSGGGGEAVAAAAAMTSEGVVRKKRSSNVNGFRAACRQVNCSAVTENSVEIINNRRKGTPHRSPLY